MKRRRFAAFILLVMICVTLLPNVVYANAAEPPSVTIIVPNAPDDLRVSIIFADESVAEEDIKASTSVRRGWETYFRWHTDLDTVSLDGAVISVTSSKYNFECAFPAAEMQRYNNILTLDLDDAVLKDGTYTGRYALIVAIRLISTLLLEGLVFLMFRYFEGRSWLAFLIINLITQAGVNITLYGADIDSYIMFGYILVEVVVFIAEAIAFPLVLRENGKGRAVVYALTANAVSLIVGGLLISYLPV